MSSALLVSFTVCFSAQLCLTGVLLFIDARAQHNSNGVFSGRDYRWERALAVVFGVLQMILSIAGLVGIVAAFRSSSDMCDWLQAGVMCSLQLAAGTNLARILQACQHPRWTVWLTYVVAVTTTFDDIPISFAEETRCVDRPPVLAPLAIASLLCAIVAYQQLESHRLSGLRQPNKNVRQLCTALIVTNAFAAVVQLSGAMLLTLAALGEDRIGVEVRQSVLLACTSTHVLCYVPFCSATIKGWITKPEAPQSTRASSTATGCNPENAA